MINSSSPTLQLEPLIRPDSINWWPLPIMAWVAIILLILLLSLLIWKIAVRVKRWHALRQQKQFAQQQLKKVCDQYRQQLHSTNGKKSTGQYPQPTSEVLCRSINILCKNYLQQLALFNSNVTPQVIDSVRSLNGPAWGQTMQKCHHPYYPCWPFKNAIVLSPRTLNIIAQGPYRPAQMLPIDLLQQELQRWIICITPKQLDHLNLAFIDSVMNKEGPC